MKKKFVLIGDIDSINLEIINKSHNLLKDKIQYLLLGNINEATNYLKRIQSNLKINEIYNPIKFEGYDANYLNFFNIDNISKKKYENLLNQINIANYFSNSLKIDLVTLPVNKSLFKKEIDFIGMTEYLAKINKKNTYMLMHGEKFSVIPLTTHINLNDVNKFLNLKFLNKSLIEIINKIKRKIYGLKFNSIKFLCYNPHCGENNTIGEEDKIISKSISNFKNITGPYSADSAFKDIKNNNFLFISMYHDQGLIPFKILNKKGINLTMGLDYRRLSLRMEQQMILNLKILLISPYFACMEY